jgi:invasion protein IalB
MRAVLLLVSGLLLAAAPAFAQATTARKVADHEHWATYSYKEKNGTVCYVLTRPVPKSSQPPKLDHGDVYFFVSRRPGQAVSLEPQFIAGYVLKEGSKVSLAVGDKKFTMFTKGKFAWVENAAEEPALIAAMKAGSDMKVQATSGKGNATSYAFSLKGVSAALNSLAACK